jgi:hypothetical protein
MMTETNGNNVSARKNPEWLRPELVASWREIAAVLIVLVAPFALSSTQAAWHILSERRLLSLFVSEREMLDNFVLEASLLGVLLIYLHWRGWRTVDLSIRPSLWSSVQGILLAPIQWFAFTAALFGVALIFVVFQAIGVFQASALFRLFVSYPHAGSHAPTHLSWAIFLWTDVLNAFLEEITYLSYAFNQLAIKRGPRFAMGITLLLRVSCHTYHGPIFVWGNAAEFIVATLWYWRTRNVWPIIVGHALLDIGIDLNLFSSMLRVLFHLFGR